MKTLFLDLCDLVRQLDYKIVCSGIGYVGDQRLLLAVGK